MLLPVGQSQRGDLDLVFFSIAAARAPLATTADNRSASITVLDEKVFP